ncbi:uncharacterized protein LOC115214512 isoform X3 [Octopus sinensis]|uniref:Uncharacterized protein LOC115214512 isoform X3 n=1 Tax=Octopus sinensis TaxID=2607531 RepID=A0A7E6F122_9MOLL|nr:uncharacterized protein LOC115214512 isoform X3 [Octopus sinensis]
MSRRRQPSPKIISSDIIDDEKIKQETWTFCDLFQQTSTNEKAITWLAKYELISNSVVCPTCGNPCTVNGYQKGIDGKRWRCPKHNYCRSIRKGSFFENSRLSLTTFIWLMYMWSREYFHSEIAHESTVSKKSTIDLFCLIRELLERFLEDHPTELGAYPPEIGGFDLQSGEPKVVEIDVTTHFKPTPNEKKHMKRFCVFGGIERGTDKCFLVPIEHQNKDAFEAAIIRWILPAGCHTRCQPSAVSKEGDISHGQVPILCLIFGLNLFKLTRSNKVPILYLIYGLNIFKLTRSNKVYILMNM